MAGSQCKEFRALRETSRGTRIRCINLCFLAECCHGYVGAVFLQDFISLLGTKFGFSLREVIKIWLGRGKGAGLDPVV